MSTRVAVVTGAGTGIGRAAALSLAGAGWAVMLAGRRPEPLATVQAECAAPERVQEIPTDVRRPDEVGRLFDETVRRFGRVDLLFNNAGIFPRAMPFEDLPLQTWQDALDVNLTGMFLCAQAAFRVMKAQAPRGGRIINNGSISAHAPRPDAVAYTCTKHAVTGLTKTLSLDGRKYDIACGQIDVGNAATELAAHMATGVKQAGGQIAIEPLMDVGQIGEAVLHMAGLPLEANVQFMTIMATKMPFVGRG